jgi:hypothetical protein
MRPPCAASRSWGSASRLMGERHAPGRGRRTANFYHAQGGSRADWIGKRPRAVPGAEQARHCPHGTGAAERVEEIEGKAHEADGARIEETADDGDRTGNNARRIEEIGNGGAPHGQCETFATQATHRTAAARMIRDGRGEGQRGLAGDRRHVRRRS